MSDSASPRPEGSLSKSPRASGGDPLQLSPERDEVQVGLEDLALGPGPLQRQGGRDLAQLFFQGSPCAARRRGLVEARGKLHGDGACAAGPARGDMAQDRHAEGAPVDAVMIMESPVFGRNDGAGERRRDVGERNPLQAPPRRVHAHLVDDAAVPVQEQRHRRGGAKRAPLQRMEATARRDTVRRRQCTGRPGRLPGRPQRRTSILSSTNES